MADSVLDGHNMIIAHGGHVPLFADYIYRAPLFGPRVPNGYLVPRPIRQQPSPAYTTELGTRMRRSSPSRFFLFFSFSIPIHVVSSFFLPFLGVFFVTFF